MSELKEKLQSIKLERDKITPDILKKGNTVFGIEGAAEGEGVAHDPFIKFNSEEEMNRYDDIQLGDGCVVLSEKTQPINPYVLFNKIIFKDSVTLDMENNANDYIQLENTDYSGDFLSANIMYNKTELRFDCYGSNFNCNVSYTSEDGINYTKTEGESEIILPKKLGCREYEAERFNYDLQKFMDVSFTVLDGFNKAYVGNFGDIYDFISLDDLSLDDIPEPDVNSAYNSYNTLEEKYKVRKKADDCYHYNDINCYESLKIGAILKKILDDGELDHDEYSINGYTYLFRNGLDLYLLNFELPEDGEWISYTSFGSIYNESTSKFSDFGFYIVDWLMDYEAGNNVFDGLTLDKIANNFKLFKLDYENASYEDGTYEKIDFDFSNSLEKVCDEEVTKLENSLEEEMHEICFKIKLPVELESLVYQLRLLFTR